MGNAHSEPIDNVLEFDGKIILSVKNAEKNIAKILYKSRKNKIKILEASIRKPSLNDVFLYLTGRQIREEVPDLKSKMKRRFMMRGR